ncbi:MAG: DUF4129 domain-containing protein [Candidatus Thermoplasmatota archaeon]
MRGLLRPALVVLVLLGALLLSSLAYNVEHIRWGKEEPAPFGFPMGERNESAFVDAQLADTVRYALIASAAVVAALAIVVAVWKEERSKLARVFLGGLAQTLIVLLLSTGFVILVIYVDAALRGVPLPRPFSVHIDLGNVLLLLGAGCIAAALAFISLIALRRERKEEEEIAIPRDEAAALIQEAVMEIRAGRDLRGTVMRCYTGMVNLFEDRGVQMRKEMTPREFQAVVMIVLGLKEESVKVLTALFEEARYSTHPITEEEKERALESLERVRGALLEVDDGRQ